MKFEYYVENLPNIGLSMKILPNEHIRGEIYILSAWLKSDVGGVHKYFLDKIENILKKSDIKEQEITANTFILSFSKEISTLKWEYNIGKNDYCSLPTVMLYNILKVWTEEFEKYRNSKK